MKKNRAYIVHLFAVIITPFLFTPSGWGQAELDFEPSVVNYKRAVKDLPAAVVFRQGPDGKIAVAQLKEFDEENLKPENLQFVEVEEEKAYDPKNLENELDADVGGQESWFFSYNWCCRGAGYPTPIFTPRYYYYGYNYSYFFYQSYTYANYYYSYYRPYYWWW